VDVPYLVQLGETIRTGLLSLPTEAVERHAAFFRSRQTSDGGFSGRDVDLNGNPLFEDGTQSDLYYTSFALRGLFSLGRVDEQTGQRAARFLTSPAGQPRSIVDLISWLSAGFILQLSTGIDLLQAAATDWPQQLADQFELCRTADGGYAKNPSGGSGSTYHSFLIVCCYELLNLPIRDPDRLLDFVRQRQRDDGGFVEIAPMRQSGTNPTAAAVALLKILNGLDDSIAQQVLEFLEEVRGDDGGYQANTRIPFSDMLSTFTGIVTSLDLNRPEAIAWKRGQRFLKELQSPQGGYLAAAWDHSPDVEYSFYGLGTRGLLEHLNAKERQQ